MKLSQEIIDKIKHGSEAGLCISFAALIILNLVPAIWQIEIPKTIDQIIGKSCITLLFVSFAVLIVSSFWASDDKKKQRIEDLREAMQELQEEEIKKKRKVPSDERIKSPLKGLTPQQEDAVIDLLRNKILVVKGRLKTSELKHLLKALQLQGDLDDSDMDHVIAWVEQVTGYDVDDRNLKYDYVAKLSEKEISKWGNIIRERYDQIEI